MSDTGSMQWLSLEEMFAGLALPPGIYFEQLARSQLDEITDRLRGWYPDIDVGTESRHLEPAFYEAECTLRGEPGDRPLYGLVCRAGDPVAGGEIVGMMTLEKNVRGRQIWSPMGAVEPTQRGLGIGQFGTVILEHVGRVVGAEVALYYATLRLARTQRNAERHGFKLVGIVPAFDRDAVAPGVIRRVYEALYAKILVPPSEVQIPAWEALEPCTRALWVHLFGAHPGSPPDPSC